MKRALVTAVAGAFGVMGAVGLIAAGPASAAPGVATCSPAILCSVTPSLETFFNSVNPANQLDTFLNGTTDEDGNNDGLGILDQPTTFVNSVGDFLSGPRLPS
jgi:hypothetical protein